ncbi:MAG TPA: hypothetical protein VFK05_14145 [Polyangiaceae bacterium]|nr:hypothetical protein [Polyangiaceae bacterium]
MRRELALVLRAKVTWLVAIFGALLVGHSFVLSLDIYATTSHSALSSALQTRELDPLLGIARPTLGGASFALALLGPILASRTLAIEKERNTYGALCLASGDSQRVILQKCAASGLACFPLLVPAIVLFLAFAASGAHLDGIETSIALAGELLHLIVIACVSTAAAAWTRTHAQAITLGLLLSVSAWAIDAAEGFAALSWLGGASSWSLEQRLQPFGRGVISIGSVLWLLTAALLFLGLALVGGSFAPRAKKCAAAAGLVALGVVALGGSNYVRAGFDWSEQRRASLPPAVVDGLRRLEEPITLELLLDRDDSRRRQLETDALAKLALARPDLSLVWPLDESSRALSGRDADYGLISIRVGGERRVTRSSSRRELVTLIFEAAGRPLPNWEQPPYPGFPCVPTSAIRHLLHVTAYFGLPLTMAALGFALTRRRTTR